jgi:tetratricopeptide (TPR) repeat protein
VGHPWLTLACVGTLACQAAVSDDAQAPPAEDARRAVAASTTAQARELLAGGDPHTAVELLEEALGLWPEQDALEISDTRRWLVHACARAGDPRRSLEHADDELQQSGGDAWLWYARGVALTTLGRCEEALVSFGQALELDPEQAKALQWRGHVNLLMGRYDAALEDLDAAMELVQAHALRDIPEGAERMRAQILWQRADALDALERHEEAQADRDAARAQGQPQA